LGGGAKRSVQPLAVAYLHQLHGIMVSHRKQKKQQQKKRKERKKQTKEKRKKHLPRQIYSQRLRLIFSIF
jgi:hypothetical protein